MFEVSIRKLLLTLSSDGGSAFVLNIDAQVLRAMFRQPLGHKESLRRVLHDGFQFHFSRSPTIEIVAFVHQPH